MAGDITVQVGGHGVALSNLDKVLWPKEHITKAELISYFNDIAPTILPHLKDRPLVLTRYPDGWQGKSFYQKNTPSSAPPWIRTASLPSERRVIRYVIADHPAVLVWLANQTAFELHPFLSRVDSIDSPDYTVFDLDPMERTTWAHVRQTALTLRAALSHLGLRGYPKTSGGDGLQIYVPLLSGATYQESRSFATAVLQAVNNVLPEITTLVRHPAARQGKLYLDALQNARGKTLVGVYAVRARPGATVSTPVKWEEIESNSLDKDACTLRTIGHRVARFGDLFLPVLRDRQNIREALARLGR
jgi:bifunctional non-homologous end joining protein LigD